MSLSSTQRIAAAVGVLTLLSLSAVVGVRAATHVAPASARTPAYDIARPLHRPKPGLFLRVPRATSPLAIDGELEDPDWAERSARTGAFIDDAGRPAKPYSDARFLWSDGLLYIVLYAADEDIRARADGGNAPAAGDDVFRVEFVRGPKRKIIEFGALGAMRAEVKLEGQATTPWNTGLRRAFDADGTPNDASDDDEEWVIEMQIPLGDLELKGEPGEQLELFIQRCDTPKHSSRRCASWGERTTPGILVLE